MLASACPSHPGSGIPDSGIPIMIGLFWQLLSTLEGPLPWLEMWCDGDELEFVVNVEHFKNWKIQKLFVRVYLSCF